MTPRVVKRGDLIYPELSYEIIGCAFDVHNELGSGLRESDYQKAMAISLTKKGIPFQEQVYVPVRFHGTVIRKGFADFVVDRKIVVEIKKGNHFARGHIDQLLRHIKAADLKLGLIVNFGLDGVRHKRIVNLLGQNHS